MPPLPAEITVTADAMAVFGTILFAVNGALVVLFRVFIAAQDARIADLVRERDRLTAALMRRIVPPVGDDDDVPE